MILINNNNEIYNFIDENQNINLYYLFNTFLFF